MRLQAENRSRITLNEGMFEMYFLAILIVYFDHFTSVL